MVSFFISLFFALCYARYVPFDFFHVIVSCVSVCTKSHYTWNLSVLIVFLLFYIRLHSGVQEKMGIMNRGVVYGLWDYNGENPDELLFREGDCMTIVRREDEDEIEWWWARMGDTEGYIPRNLLGVSHQKKWWWGGIYKIYKSLYRIIYVQMCVVDMSSCCR